MEAWCGSLGGRGGNVAFVVVLVEVTAFAARRGHIINNTRLLVERDLPQCLQRVLCRAKIHNHNHMRGGDIYLEWEPITCGERVYTYGGNQSHEGKGYIPRVGTNHMRVGGIYHRRNASDAYDVKTPT
jgi:hypothetical protein